MNTLNLSEDVLKGIETLSDEKLISENVFKHIIDCCFQVILKRKTESDLFENKATSSVDSIALKQTYSAFIVFILETMKINYDQASTKDLLEEHKLSANRVEFILNYFKEYRVAIRKVLSVTNFHFPHIIDVNWRLDFFMKSNAVEKLNQPVYIINLTTEQEENIKGKVQFACTLEQLQDLVFKLRDAQKQIERSSIKS